jgi:3-methyladenine DNA glycosylase Mpg
MFFSVSKNFHFLLHIKVLTNVVCGRQSQIGQAVLVSAKETDDDNDMYEEENNSQTVTRN